MRHLCIVSFWSIVTGLWEDGPQQLISYLGVGIVRTENESNLY